MGAQCAINIFRSILQGVKGVISYGHWNCHLIKGIDSQQDNMCAFNNPQKHIIDYVFKH